MKTVVTCFLLSMLAIAPAMAEQKRSETAGGPACPDGYNRTGGDAKCTSCEKLECDTSGGSLTNCKKITKKVCYQETTVRGQQGIRATIGQMPAKAR